MKNEIKRLTITSTQTPSTESTAALQAQEELALLRSSHSIVLAKMAILAQDLENTKAENSRLEEENVGWEFLVRERTLNGTMLEGGGLLSRNLSLDVPTADSPFDLRHDWQASQTEQLDEGLDQHEQAIYLNAQAPEVEDEDHLVRNLDGCPVSPGRRRLKKKISKMRKEMVMGSGVDLAAELDRAEEVAHGSDERAFRKGAVSESA